MIQNRAMSFFEISSAPVTIGKIMPLAARRDDEGQRLEAIRRHGHPVLADEDHGRSGGSVGDRDRTACDQFVDLIPAIA